MFWIVCIVWDATIGAVAKFGDSRSDVVIDAEGYRAFGYCLAPKSRFNENLTFERRSTYT